MRKSARVGLAWGTVLLIVQLLLGAVIVPRLGELGQRAASNATLGGIGLIVLGAAVIVAVLGRRLWHGNQPSG